MIINKTEITAILPAIKKVKKIKNTAKKKLYFFLFFKSLSKTKMNIFSKKFEGYLYDLGEKYSRYEINLVKIKLNKIFIILND